MSGEHALFDCFALADTQVVRLHAELKADPRHLPETRAQVEIKLSPVQPDAAPASGPPTYQISARLKVIGQSGSGQNQRETFAIECVMNALYRQVHGAPMTFAEFSAGHRALTRQLYPLMHHQLLPLIRQLGLQQVRLPQDIVHRTEAAAPPAPPTHH